MALAHLTTPLASVANSTLGAFADGRFVCKEFYGAWEWSTNCVAAIDKMPSGDAPITYTINSGYDRATRLPQYYQSGDCMIQIEMAGPKQPPTVIFTPSELKILATRTLENCAVKKSYIGGFLFGDLDPMKQWITSEQGDLDKPFPPATSFPTISLSSPQPDYLSPGNYDLAIPYVFSQSVIEDGWGDDTKGEEGAMVGTAA
ncbi:MAG: hypothetical protein Q9218_007703 [Villophora microphyllina]